MIVINFVFLFGMPTENESGKSGKVGVTALSAITNLKKLCSHPELVYDKCAKGIDGFDGALSEFPTNFDPRYVKSNHLTVHSPSK